MKNPMNKRIPRELKQDIGKYLVIFLFMVMLISLVSGFLVADNSVFNAYNEGFTKYNLEWGHFTFDNEAEDELLTDIEKDGDVKIYDLKYFEEENESDNANIRVYVDREEVNLEDIMSGEMPKADDEIALDRMYAQNAKIEIGDTITLKGKDLKVTGFIAVPDYSCLFESNTDMMFDSVTFSIAVMTESGFEAMNSSNIFYNYAWMYNNEPADEIKEKEMSDDFTDVLVEKITAYDTSLIETQSEKPIVTLSNYIPRYTNQAINFTGEDMGGDKATFIVFDYIVIVILAFVFAVTISNTIAKEAGVIGTLRASGYSKGEMVRHYMVLPVLVTLIAGVVGNILGYTVLREYMVGVYYNSYSLCTYKTLWDGEAFIITTVIPVIIMFVITLVTLIRKMRISPLQFLRHELKKNNKKKAFRLNTNIPFITRFRIRIIFQNIPNYITLFFGIFLAGVIIVFGFMFGPLLEDYANLISDSMIANYQYVLKTEVETDNADAEKYCMSSLKTTREEFMIDEISIYGIDDNSKYITTDIPEGEVLVSNGVMDKFGYKIGDKITLKAPYSDDKYTFTIAGEYEYNAALSVFMNRDMYIETFEKSDSYFTGYFSNEELTDIEDEDVAMVITEKDFTKISTQLLTSMGDFMALFKFFGVIMFLLMMYILSKQIIEKNTQSISMTKILGFTNLEIGGLYIIATSIVVILSLLISVPIIDVTLRWIFSGYLYKEITGYIPYIVSKNCYIAMVVLGIISYAIIAVLQMIKISRIPKSDALKNVE